MGYDLTDEEAVLLDGKCAEKIQAKVDAAKARLAAAARLAHLTPAEAGFIANVVSEALKTGRLRYAYCGIRSCDVCGKTAGYAKWKGNGRTHRKGEPRYDKPLTMGGIELADRFISMAGYATVGCCRTCFDKVLPDLRAALDDVRAEVPEALTGRPPRFTRHDRRKCRSCGWTGHEGEMGRVRCYMGVGTFPGRCPSCAKESMMFGTQFDHVGGFDVVENAPKPPPPGTE